MKHRYTIKLHYLFRDTLEIVGSRALKLVPATCGIFYVNKSSPFSGGTGHTIRVCGKNGFPVEDQKAWPAWDL
ncbi:MAG: hypothetical protein H8E10_21455 [Desulfobacterales bacterium]|nr:hypothetical protein [Desulfobacterales bacterium]MBL7172426.1 hypothetical protein [Desulfobacteraceae bacterium]